MYHYYIMSVGDLGASGRFTDGGDAAIKIGRTGLIRKSAASPLLNLLTLVFE